MTFGQRMRRALRKFWNPKNFDQCRVLEPYERRALHALRRSRLNALIPGREHEVLQGQYEAADMLHQHRRGIVEDYRRASVVRRKR